MAITPILETKESTTANSNINSNSSATSSAAGSSNNNARIIRFRGGGANSNNNSNANNNNTSTPTHHRQYVRPRISLADFQDGKRFSAAENTSILKDTVGVFQNISTRLLQSPAQNVNDRGGDRRRHRHPRYHQGGKLDDERSMNDVRFGVGLYQNFPLANALLAGSNKRERALKKSGHKQMNHVRGTDGWWRSMLVIEDRAMDTYLGPWIVICLNALFACILTEVADVKMPEETLRHWDTVYSLVLKTSLAFLLVFRLNRCAMRYWEARTLWGNVTHLTRNLVGALLLYGSHCPKHRDSAIKWGSSFCVASKHFIRSERDEYPLEEFAGFLSRDQITRLRDANHAPLFAAAMCRHYLSKMFFIDEHTPAGLAHAYSIRLQECESYVSQLVAQVSGMEKIRSTPLPIAYVAHLRTFLFAYCVLLPYVWVSEWSWATIPLCAFTAFALLGIEGASSEVEIPFRKERSNHLALDAYCLVILDSVLGLVVHDANMHIQGRKGKASASTKDQMNGYDSDDDDDDDEDVDDDDDDEENDNEDEEENVV